MNMCICSFFLHSYSYRKYVNLCHQHHFPKNAHLTSNQHRMLCFFIVRYTQFLLLCCDQLILNLSFFQSKNAALNFVLFITKKFAILLKFVHYTVSILPKIFIFRSYKAVLCENFFSFPLFSFSVFSWHLCFVVNSHVIYTFDVIIYFIIHQIFS